MACNACETFFQGSQSLVVSVTKSGTNATLFVSNQSRNIAHIRRILLCTQSSMGTSILFLRPPPDQISWLYPTAFLEPGISATYYTLSNVPAGAILQAQAEYIEIDGRSRSCPAS
jgi:hypothetical protein